MGDLFRSEKMVLCQMFMQQEAAYASVAALGERGCVQFRDLNTDVKVYQRKFVSEVRRCDDIERKLRYIEKELITDDIKLMEIDEENEPSAPHPREIVNLEAQVESIETEIRELSQNDTNLTENYNGLMELKQLLEHTESFFSDQEVLNFDTNRSAETEDPTQMPQSREQLAYVAGVINLERFFPFERMLWRISHGNVFVRRSDLDGLSPDKASGRPTKKSAFVAFFQGEQLKLRVKKVCAGFHASVYPCPSAHIERMEMIKDVSTRLEDLKIVVNQTLDHRNRVLVTASKHLPHWMVMLKKIKSIYHTLNLFNMDVSNKCLIGEGWAPERDIDIVKKALVDGSLVAQSTIPSFCNVIETDEEPPSYTRTNKFTKGFQNLIESYGVSSYRELNPALYTCITFPFLFAVMYGDVGHGVIVFLIGLLMVLFEKKIKVKDEIANIFFTGRYIILLMGIFSLYTGFIYNDIFSKSMNVFGSRWRVMYNTSTVLENKELQLNPSYATVGTYPMGMDPIWQLAGNKIIFLNTYKMKLSIIFGVVHMLFGIVMSLVNAIHFKRWMNIILDFLPQTIFLLLLFGYMVFMMFFKWVKFTARTDELQITPGCAPSILIIFINMLLFNKHTTPLDGCNEYMFESQEVLQIVFLCVAVACIPWMLFGRPLYIKWCRHRAKKELRSAQSMEENLSTSYEEISFSSEKTPSKPAEEPMSEIMILQAIHSIEYVLSTISHTASYLRLWALSLAHAQLSEVAWNLIFHFGFIIPGPVSILLIYFLFFAWSNFTFGILVVIEGLSAFLHTLRLHWVEFMSKFYDGSGYAFRPFCFKAILNSTSTDN